MKNCIHSKKKTKKTAALIKKDSDADVSLIISQNFDYPQLGNVLGQLLPVLDSVCENNNHTFFTSFFPRFSRSLSVVKES